CLDGCGGVLGRHLLASRLGCFARGLLVTLFGLFGGLLGWFSCFLGGLLGRFSCFLGGLLGRFSCFLGRFSCFLGGLPCLPCRFGGWRVGNRRSPRRLWRERRGRRGGPGDWHGWRRRLFLFFLATSPNRFLLAE